MSFIEIYLWCAAGVVISVVLPIIRKYLPKTNEIKTQGAWAIIRPILMVGLFSLLTSLLLVAFFKDQLQDWRAALLAGYAWDSTLQKLKG